MLHRQRVVQTAPARPAVAGRAAGRTWCVPGNAGNCRIAGTTRAPVCSASLAVPEASHTGLPRNVVSADPGQSNAITTTAPLASNSVTTGKHPICWNQGYTGPGEHRSPLVPSRDPAAGPAGGLGEPHAGDLVHVGRVFRDRDGHAGERPEMTVAHEHAAPRRGSGPQVARHHPPVCPAPSRAAG